MGERGEREGGGRERERERGRRETDRKTETEERRNKYDEYTLDSHSIFFHIVANFEILKKDPDTFSTL